MFQLAELLPIILYSLPLPLANERKIWLTKEGERERESKWDGQHARRLTAKQSGFELGKALRISDLQIAYKTSYTSSKASQKSHSVGCLLVGLFGQHVLFQLSTTEICTYYYWRSFLKKCVADDILSYSLFVGFFFFWVVDSKMWSSSCPRDKISMEALEPNGSSRTTSMLPTTSILEGA